MNATAAFLDYLGWTNVTAAAPTPVDTKQCKLFHPDTMNTIKSPNPVLMYFCWLLSGIFLK